MKKIMYLFLACGAFFFAACSSGAGNADATSEEAVVEEAVVEEAVVEEAVVDSTSEEAAHDHGHNQ